MRLGHHAVQLFSVFSDELFSSIGGQAVPEDSSLQQLQRELHDCTFTNESQEREQRDAEA